jgi:hypothetical protein
VFKPSNLQNNPFAQRAGGKQPEQVRNSYVPHNHGRDWNRTHYANTSSHYQDAAHAANNSSSLQDTYRHQYPMSAEEKAVMNQLNSFLKQMQTQFMMSTISQTVGFGLSALLPIFFLGALF